MPNPAFDPGALLRRLFRIVEAANDPEVSAWLARGVERHQAAGEHLEHALGLAGADATRARDAALRLAAERLSESEPGLSSWALAGRLEEAIRRFESGALPRIRRGEAVTLSPVAAALLAAHESGARMLRSRRRLYDLIA